MSGSRAPRCITCGASLGAVRLVIAGQWTCPDCRYELEHGVAERAQCESGSPEGPQVERLFPVEPYDRNGGGEAA
jgi:hypothetical protein